jgi:hypothetical protein
VNAYRETIGRRARDYAVREFTGGVAARYLELLADPREPIRATGGTVS